MADDNTDDLDFAVIVVRFDRQAMRTIVDLGGVDLYHGLTMLSLAVDGIRDELEAAIVTVEGEMVIVVNDDEEDE